ncbi:hypothetical protein [Gelidibacter maritimus]|uniref:Uncharacterized protein n=1 Tax=Gelidibacter maritimus TaxID=2761487 RepID=A0A7W2R4A4_9FLAO|nr:hypothetical protein [Gelidibacter maritimus]MBA6152875.1 hypothetical protein [Gelidibacter maritimus]
MRTAVVDVLPQGWRDFLLVGGKGSIHPSNYVFYDMIWLFTFGGINYMYYDKKGE